MADTVKYMIAAEIVTAIEAYRRLALASTKENKRGQVTTFETTVTNLLNYAIVEKTRQVEKPAKDKAVKAVKEARNTQNAAKAEWSDKFAAAMKKNDKAEIDRLTAELLKSTK